MYIIIYICVYILIHILKSNIRKLVNFFYVSTNISYVPYTTGEPLLTIFENCPVSMYFHV